MWIYKRLSKSKKIAVILAQWVLIPRIGTRVSLKICNALMIWNTANMPMARRYCVLRLIWQVPIWTCVTLWFIAFCIKPITKRVTRGAFIPCTITPTRSLMRWRGLLTRFVPLNLKTIAHFTIGLSPKWALRFPHVSTNSLALMSNIFWPVNVS